MRPFFLVYVVSMFATHNAQTNPYEPRNTRRVLYIEQGEGTPQDEVEDLKKDILGLEFYIRDKKNYKTHCSHIKWEQPSIKIYKKDPKSYLPDGCVINKEQEKIEKF